jgi:outer membrane immunogenic protein
MKRFWLSTVAFLVTAPAFAADLPTHKAPPVLAPPPAEYDWTGAFVGGNITWAWGSNSFDAYNAATGVLSRSGTDNSSTFHGGLQAGYNYMFASRMVIGASASLDIGSDSTSTSSNAAGTNISSTRSSDNVGGKVLARLGYAFGDFLPYVNGGWGWSTGTATRTQLVGTTGGAGPGFSESTSVSRNGWVLGGGAEYRFWGNWSVFTEYEYTRYARVGVLYPTAGVLSQSTLTDNSVTLGVNYKF